MLGVWGNGHNELIAHRRFTWIIMISNLVDYHYHEIVFNFFFFFQGEKIKLMLELYIHQ